MWFPIAYDLLYCICWSKTTIGVSSLKKVLKIWAGRAITLMKTLKPSSMYSYTFGDMNSTVWTIWAAPGGEGFFFQLS